MPDYPILTALVEEAALSRAALGTLVSSWPELRLAWTASGREEAIFAARATPPDLLVLSIRLSGSAMADFISTAKAAAPRLLVVGLGDKEDDRAAADAIRNGCHGYAAKDQDENRFRHVILEVAEGRYAVTPGVDVPSAFLAARQPLNPLDALSTRERQVFTMLADGAKVRRIGELLALSPKTVDSYRASLMRKLNLDDFAALMRLALEQERHQSAAAGAHGGVAFSSADSGPKRAGK